MKITLKSFFNKYIIHPFSKKLPNHEKAVATVSSGIFLVLGLGTLHYRAWRKEKKAKQLKQDQRTKSILQHTISTPPPEAPKARPETAIKEVTLQKQEPVLPAKKFIDHLTPQQKSLYQKLLPLEQQLYENLSRHEGALADLVLLILKGNVKTIKVEGNKVLLDLNPGKTSCKVLGFDLTASLPKRLILQHSPQKMVFSEKIPFDYNGFYILSAESANFSKQGVKVNADYSLAAKLSGRSKILDPYLSSAEIFNLFS